MSLHIPSTTDKMIVTMESMPPDREEWYEIMYILGPQAYWCVAQQNGSYPALSLFQGPGNETNLSHLLNT